MRFSRYVAHLLVALAFIITAVAPSLVTVEEVSAAPVVTPTPEPGLLPDTFYRPALQRDALTDRTQTPELTPTPMPTPVAVDPNATPLAAPTLPPAPVIVIPLAPVGPLIAAAPAIVPVIGWLAPIPLNIGQYFSVGHPALDILAPCGTPVVASLGGTITQAGWKDNGGGNVVTVASPGGFVIEYNHLQGVALTGGDIAAGTVIGWIGATGWATGCHLHYTVILNGVFQDPLAYL